VFLKEVLKRRSCCIFRSSVITLSSVEIVHGHHRGVDATFKCVYKGIHCSVRSTKTLRFRKMCACKCAQNWTHRINFKLSWNRYNYSYRRHWFLIVRTITTYMHSLFITYHVTLTTHIKVTPYCIFTNRFTMEQVCQSLPNFPPKYNNPYKCNAPLKSSNPFALQKVTPGVTIQRLRYSHRCQRFRTSFGNTIATP
jgi:hypothetical protein